MTQDAYSPCPCGSGKKFKWCCQPIHVTIDKAYRQESEGQHEAALKTMEQVTAEHPGNPEAWGRYAQLLYINNRVDEAESTLEKAFAINPNYPFGHLLRGTFRQYEGEIPGALMLFRKAADLYSPEAPGPLAHLYSEIANNELKMNRPVAAHAALKLAQRCAPADEGIRQAMTELFGDKPALPAAAARDYTFRGPAGSIAPEQRTAWQQALAGAATGKLGDAARVFDQLTQQYPDEPAGWYNLTLARAWLGDNKGALEAIDRYVALEPDENQAGAVWALGEVLRQGQGLEDQADYVEYSYLLRVRDPEPVVNALQELEKTRRFVVLETRQEQGAITGLILAKMTSLVTDVGGPRYPRLGSYFLMMTDVVRLWNVNREELDKVREELQQLAGLGLTTEGRMDRRCAGFGDVLAGSLSFPIGVTDQAEAEKGLREQVQKYFEEVWLHQPLKSLSGVPPIDAAGHGTLRKKLLGVVQFIQDCAVLGARPYDFDRLRRKLGLLAGEPAAAAGGAAVDIAGLGTPELAALGIESLSDEQLEQAYQAAIKLDARDLAGRFAQASISRPPRPSHPDRYPWFAYLIQLALGESDADRALGHVDAGEKDDCEHNEGRRRNDYELRRGQLHAKRGETDQAQDVFDRLIQRVPDELKYRGSAVEAMLAAKQGALALRLAEQGLAKAREQNNRDSEQYFLELQAAARKLGG